MTRQDQEKWNTRYLDQAVSSEPSELVSGYWGLAPKGRALDIACGNGRNARFLARQGFSVDAVDISDIALGLLPDNDPRISVLCEDIDTWQMPEDRYTLILNIRFLERRLFPMIKKGLKPGGVLIFESFIDDTRAYSLKPNELLEVFREFRMVYYQEKANDPSDTFDQTVYMVAVKQ